MIPYLAILLAAAFVAALATPLARRLALRCGIVDHPDPRKQHREPVPYLGGLAVFVGLLSGFGMLLGFARHPAESFSQLDPRIWALVAGATAMFGLGVLDDWKNVRARNKLAVQLIIAASMWFAGIRIDQLKIADGLVVDFGSFGFVVTVLWIAGVTNAVNFIDGLDGLASGIGVIASAAIGFVAFQSGHYPCAAAMAALCGSLLGFLPYNRHPAKIFLGDAGSLLIGFLLSTSAVTCSSKSAAFASVAAPFLALALPILDMCFAMMRRFIERRSLFSSDRNHIHHRLLALGVKHPRVVQLLWLETAVLTALALVLLYVGTNNWLRLVAFVAVLAGHVWFFRVTGAVRLKESIAALRDAKQRLQMSRWHQKCFDELDLRFRGAKSPDGWWRSVESAAERLGFRSVTVHHEEEERRWQWTADPLSLAETPSMAFECAIGTNSSRPAKIQAEIVGLGIEAPTQAFSVLAKLLDRHPLPTASQPASRSARATKVG